VIEVCAKGIRGHVMIGRNSIPVEDLSQIYGSRTFRISHQEISDTLKSQKIYTSALLPLVFYRGLKDAMKRDQIVTLPGSDAKPKLLKQWKGEVGKFLKQVQKDPLRYGFSSEQQFANLASMTLYQIGAMVIKSEDFRILIDGDGRLIERKAGERDAIRLINACGIRGVRSRATPKEHNREIMTQTFRRAFTAAERGMAIFPAVGMGVWGGDPDLYWRAFLDAVVSSADDLEVIYVNPGHQKTPQGKYAGCNGNEFQTLLHQYRLRYADDPQALINLDKIVNLFDSGKDIVQLARQLKKAYPDKIVSLFNASDPDVTLGNHVGEYVNNMPHTLTTEENYTAMGTNGLCFEGITGIHKSQVRATPAGIHYLSSKLP
jgi:hypothetical protein